MLSIEAGFSLGTTLECRRSPQHSAIRLGFDLASYAPRVNFIQYHRRLHCYHFSAKFVHGSMHTLLQLHILGGGLAIIAGGMALAATKGGALHRKSGIVFVYSMLVLGTSASILAFDKGGFTHPNFLGGFMAAYFVITALTTVRDTSVWSRRLDVAAAVFALAYAILVFARGVRAMGQPHFIINGVPAAMLFFLATIFAVAFVGDLRIIRFGAPRGASRLRRHLWRMCFGLFVAAGSFFSIRERVAKILPEPFLSTPMRALPILLIFVTMFYWLWRVRSRRSATRAAS